MLCTFRDIIFCFKSIPAYATNAPNTKIRQENTHADTALNPSDTGELEMRLLKILITTKNRVTSSAILPGITSGSIKKLTCKTMWLHSNCNYKLNAKYIKEL